MNRFKGTPAPWVVNDNGVYFEVKEYGHYGHLADICGSQIIYDEKSHKKDGVAYANACLIASAPELLGEIIRLRNILSKLKTDSDDNLYITDAVISKALGELK